MCKCARPRTHEHTPVPMATRAYARLCALTLARTCCQESSGLSPQTLPTSLDMFGGSMMMRHARRCMEV